MNQQLPALDISKGARHAASALLASGMLFEHLRTDLARLGLLGEEAVGVALFFTFASRFRRCPLRLAVEERKAGGTKYAVKAVCELLEPEVLCQAYAEGGWRRFQENPNQKIILVSNWSSTNISARCDGDVFTRTIECEEGGRVVNRDRFLVQGRFVCVAPTVDDVDGTRGRWLHVTLPDPSSRPSMDCELDDCRREVWIAVDKLLQERAQIEILLPDWADLFFAYAARNEFVFLNMPAFLESWKTMALLRSFQFDGRWRQANKTGFYVADFSDLAYTSAIMRAFKERHTFPSLQRIFEALFTAGNELPVVSPLTGKTRKYKFAAPPVARRPFWEDLRAAGHI